MQSYEFTSERLGFRTWKTSDFPKLLEMNTHQEVMRYFPTIQTAIQCREFIERMETHYRQHGYCYFAVEELATEEFIGFIGLSLQTYDIDFNPSTDIGWRLLPNYWGKGYATEGAKACLNYGFKELNLKEIVSVAPTINLPSLAVMKKIGMVKVKDFKHPLLTAYPELETCSLFAIQA